MLVDGGMLSLLVLGIMAGANDVCVRVNTVGACVVRAGVGGGLICGAGVSSSLLVLELFRLQTNNKQSTFLA